MKFLLKSVFVVACVLSSFTASAEKINDMPLTGLAGTPSTSFQQLEGQWLYVDFWASWCGPCKQSFPFMVQLQDVFKSKNVKVVAITVDETEAAALNFLKNNETNFAVFHDPKGDLAKEFKVPGMPSSYLINPQGEVVYKHVGFTKESGGKIIEAISEAIAK